MPSDSVPELLPRGTRHKALVSSRDPERMAVLLVPLKMWKEYGLKKPVQPRFVNRTRPSRLFAKSQSGKIKASICRLAIDAQEPASDFCQDAVIGCLEDRKWRITFAAVLDITEYVCRRGFE